MIRYIYSAEDSEKIIALENESIYRYKKLIKQYETKLSDFGCSIDLMCCWTTLKKNKSVKQRPEIKNGYVFWICYQILEKGYPVVCDDEGSFLEHSYGVLSVESSKKFLHTKNNLIIKLFDDMEDVKIDLNNDLAFLKRTQGDGSSVFDNSNN